MISEAVYFVVIFKIKSLLYSELLQGSLARIHVSGKPLIVFLDQKVFDSQAALLASLFLLVRASRLFRHVTKIGVYSCTNI